MNMLNILKLIHTLIWLFFNVVIFYMLYAVLINKIDISLWICLSIVVMEGIVLLIFKRSCPITLVARKYSSSQKDNFDIYLPNWLAKHNKTIYSLIMVVIIIILMYRMACLLPPLVSPIHQAIPLIPVVFLAVRF
jgi:hypothetical protein